LTTIMRGCHPSANNTSQTPTSKNSKLCQVDILTSAIFEIPSLSLTPETLGFQHKETYGIRWLDFSRPNRMQLPAPQNTLGTAPSITSDFSFTSSLFKEPLPSTPESTELRGAEYCIHPLPRRQAPEKVFFNYS